MDQERTICETCKACMRNPEVGDCQMARTNPENCLIVYQANPKEETV